MDELLSKDLYSNIKELINTSRNRIVQAVNTTIVYTYFEIGRLIVEHLQDGEDRASYGKKVLKSLSERLSMDFGKGFSVQNIERMRTFYQLYSKPSVENSISSTLLRKFNDENYGTPYPTFVLSWSHYVFLMRIENTAERQFYEIEAFENNWSLRELKRQFDSSLYERLALSRDKSGVKELPKDANIHAAKYQTYLPNKQELKKIIEETE
jgi:hypothetical protein